MGFDVGRKPAPFLEGLKITYQSIFLSASWNNIKSVEKSKEKHGKTENIFYGVGVWISVGSRPNFWKVLTLPIIPYFCRRDRIILSALKKIKKNMEKQKIFFFYGVGFGYPSEEVTFS